MAYRSQPRIWRSCDGELPLLAGAPFRFRPVSPRSYFLATFRRITRRDSAKKLAESAARHEEHLYRALDIALARARSSRPIIRQVLKRATVEGISLTDDVKAATIVFPVPELKRTWIRIIPWEGLEGVTPRQTAAEIIWTLRQNLWMTETDNWPKPRGSG